MSAGLTKLVSAHISQHSVSGASQMLRKTFCWGVSLRSPQVSVDRVSSSRSESAPSAETVSANSRLSTRRSLNTTLQSGSVPRSATSRLYISLIPAGS